MRSPLTKSKIAIVLRGRCFLLQQVDIEIPDKHWDMFDKMPPLSVIYETGDYNVARATKMYQEKAGTKVVTDIEVKK